MRKVTRVLLSAFCLLGMGSAWAGTLQDNNPADFTDPINWCQFGCQGGSVSSPTAFASNGGATGMVGMNGTGDSMVNDQTGVVGWAGGFTYGMGLLFNNGYNIGTGGGTPAGIALMFDTPVNGVGAYIDSNFLGAFTASLTLYDSSFNVIGTFTEAGTSAFAYGTAPFIGAWDGSADIAVAVFSAVGANGPAGTEPDFALGTTILNYSPQGPVVPEPSSFVLLGLGLAGVGFKLRRRGQKA